MIVGDADVVELFFYIRASLLRKNPILRNVCGDVTKWKRLSWHMAWF